jgi:hypothetical protein
VSLSIRETEASNQEITERIAEHQHKAKVGAESTDRCSQDHEWQQLSECDRNLATGRNSVIDQEAPMESTFQRTKTQEH